MPKGVLSQGIHESNVLLKCLQYHDMACPCVVLPLHLKTWGSLYNARKNIFAGHVQVYIVSSFWELLVRNHRPASRAVLIYIAAWVKKYQGLSIYRDVKDVDPIII